LWKGCNGTWLAGARQIAEVNGGSVLRDAEEVYGVVSRSKWAA